MIVMYLKGGLGNQMFQYAVGRHLAHIHNTELKMDISAYDYDAHSDQCHTDKDSKSKPLSQEQGAQQDTGNGSDKAKGTDMAGTVPPDQCGMKDEAETGNNKSLVKNGSNNTEIQDRHGGRLKE